ncbi:hypothetical protein ACB092_05G135100 [Castanea dentata]
MEKAVPRGRVAKPRDSYVEDNGRTSVFPKLQDEQEVDVKNTLPVSLSQKNHVLQQHTNSFSHENFIGEGMLGSVYRGELPDGKVRFFYLNKI